MPRSPLPTLPTPLPTVEVAGDARRGVPHVVLGRPGEATDDEVTVALGPGGDALDQEWITSCGATGKAGETHAAPGRTPRWLLGVGDGGPKQWRTAGAALARAVNGRAKSDSDAGRTAARSVQVRFEDGADAEEIAAFVLGVTLGGYGYTVTSEQALPTLRTVRLIVAEDRIAEVTAIVANAVGMAEATAFTRDLANTPSNVKDPAWLASTAARVADGVPGLRATVRDENWLSDNGFGGVLAVGGGSSRPPRLIELSWRPRGATGPHLVFVGKGITFDTGGISIKPADGMHLMRTDMAGGAAVISALIAIARLRLPVRVTGLVPCAENHVSGSAYRPGDVVRHYGGQTTEVTNTDAEGRMVLADAIEYARARLKPDHLVDVATLTGAMKVSLGVRTAGLFATDDALAERVAEAGGRVGEAWWRMPLLEEVADAVHSDIADVRQMPKGPGGIAAASFLRAFVGETSWAHLDIAGPARAEKAYDEVVPGASGFGARTLVELAASFA
ncbi:leucyl aminopeptidase [Herbihabitans rhizosphaerae]|uniref:Probable cytosol aminopeptidase n=1 Tax=Herbihabitans rhizosphaerae TaxID=1872711 RepID=A0A4Q7L505_9PSEU|nr:leucyl aminopeptidase [Herbihabitans rhizosphaerae]RZS44296.1 leucyl aminopeptidase [Herbihabitans rhizosphaerae]